MRPRIFYELSRHLAILLEKGLRGGPESARIPVFLCHPLDPLEAQGPQGSHGPGGAREELGAHTAGILYPVRFSPEARYRQAGMTLEPPGAGQPRDRLRFPGLWVRVRYVFLVAGGSMEDQLEALAAALRTLHDGSVVEVPAVAGEGESGAAEGGTYPLRIVEDPEGWRELGLAEHRWTVSFEVTVPIASSRAEEVDRILEREVRLEEGTR